MKKILIGILLMCSIFSLEANAAQYKWKEISQGGMNDWICYKDNVKAHGWNNIDGNWYYFYDMNGYMAHDTFVDGYYLNSDGAWTNDVPYVVQRIINVVPDSEWIYTAGNIGYEGIGIFPNKNLKDMCGSGWNAPDVNGTFVSIVENDFFVASDGTVYKAPHQAGETMYRYDDNGNIVQAYYYNNRI